MLFHSRLQGTLRVLLENAALDLWHAGRHGQDDGAQVARQVRSFLRERYSQLLICETACANTSLSMNPINELRV